MDTQWLVDTPHVPNTEKYPDPPDLNPGCWGHNAGDILTPQYAIGFAQRATAHVIL